MRILLVGEYSNLHNSLKKGLQELGHEVLILSTGDGFKRFPSDLDVRSQLWQDNVLLNAFRQVVFKIFKKDLALIHTARKTLRVLRTQKKFDVIQLINEYPLKTPYALEKKIITKLKALTPRLYCLAAGDDYVYLHNIEKLPYHPIRQHGDKISFRYSEKYLTKQHKSYHRFVFKKLDGVIASDLDYHTVYKGRTKYKGIIPNPITIDSTHSSFPKIQDKIIIFHGINRVNYYKKGNDIFDQALLIIKERYPDRVYIQTVESLPYKHYINAYTHAHILLDQVYAVDQGYNALEAMAQGKVVFTGAGKIFCEHYNLTPDTVAIHTIPDVDTIVNKLSELIENPERLKAISINAKAFIDTYHSHTNIAQKYINSWLDL